MSGNVNEEAFTEERLVERMLATEIMLHVPQWQKVESSLRRMLADHQPLTPTKLADAVALLDVVHLSLLGDKLHAARWKHYPENPIIQTLDALVAAMSLSAHTSIRTHNEMGDITLT